MSQNETILKALKHGQKLTVLKALKDFDCYALSQRIGELKREGHPIKSEFIKTKSKKTIKRYWI